MDTLSQLRLKKNPTSCHSMVSSKFGRCWVGVFICHSVLIYNWYFSGTGACLLEVVWGGKGLTTACPRLVSMRTACARPLAISCWRGSGCSRSRPPRQPAAASDKHIQQTSLFWSYLHILPLPEPHFSSVKFFVILILFSVFWILLNSNCTFKTPTVPGW